MSYRPGPRLLEVKGRDDWILSHLDDKQDPANIRGCLHSLTISLLRAPQETAFALRPLASSPRFAAYFENIIKAGPPDEAARRLGYSNPGILYHHLARLNISKPQEWSRRPDLNLHQRVLVPDVSITDPV